MSMREYWFNGTALDVCHLEDFCTEENYERLREDLIAQTIHLPRPLETFVDENDDIYLTVEPYQICSLSDNKQLSRFKFYKKEAVAEELFDVLSLTYLDFDLDVYQDIFEAEISSKEDLKQVFIKTISDCFAEVEICHYG